MGFSLSKHCKNCLSSKRSRESGLFHPSSLWLPLSLISSPGCWPHCVIVAIKSLVSCWRIQVPVCSSGAGLLRMSLPQPAANSRQHMEVVHQTWSVLCGEKSVICVDSHEVSACLSCSCLRASTVALSLLLDLSLLGFMFSARQWQVRETTSGAHDRHSAVWSLRSSCK